MKIIESEVSVRISGVNIDKDFNIDNTMFDNKLTGIKCIKSSEDSVNVNAKIKSNDKNLNYIIAERFAEYIHNLFCIFGVRVSMNGWDISTDTDLMYGTVDVKHPPFIIKGEEVNEQAKRINDDLLEDEMSGFFYNLREAHGTSGSIHRFRSLFSIFDRLSEKTERKSINYHKMKIEYKKEIERLYKSSEYFARFLSCVNKLEESELEDEFGNNYSNKLKEARRNLDSSEFINDDVAEYILRCIQVIRNRLNHGSFKGINEVLVNTGYELLLPYVQKLIKEKTRL